MKWSPQLFTAMSILPLPPHPFKLLLLCILLLALTCGLRVGCKMVKAAPRPPLRSAKDVKGGKKAGLFCSLVLFAIE